MILLRERSLLSLHKACVMEPTKTWISPVDRVSKVKAST